MAHFYCTRCKEMIPEREVREQTMTEEEKRQLRDFAAETAMALGREPHEPEFPTYIYHIRVECVSLSGDPNVCGSYLDDVECGPVREPTAEEISAHEEEGRWKALYGDSR